MPFIFLVTLLLENGNSLECSSYFNCSIESLYQKCQTLETIYKCNRDWFFSLLNRVTITQITGKTEATFQTTVAGSFVTL